MNNKNVIILLAILLSVSVLSCNKIKNKTRAKFSKSGEDIGKTSTEFIENVGEGIDKALSLKIQVSEELLNKGFATGKYSIESSDTTENNILVLYLIFNEDFNETINLKAFDKSDLEIGRINMKVKGKKDEAIYYDFEFDQRTILDKRGKIIISKK